MNGTLDLSALDLALGVSLVLGAGLVSFALRLGLEKRLAIASLRTVLQLLLIGYLLKFIFELQSALAVLPLIFVMIFIAARTALERPRRRFQGGGGLAFLSLAASALITTFAVTSLVIGVEPWFAPRYVIPLIGMVLGNSMNGISLSLDALLEHLAERADEVELELSLGASAREAARRPLQEAVRRGMIPILNTMMVVGIVSLPGMMTGQILAGADPMLAVKYQILIMFMIAASTAMGAMLMSMLTARKLFSREQRLLRERILRRK